MSITPSFLNFSCKKNYPLPPRQIIHFNNPYFTTNELSSYSLESNVDWIFGQIFTSTSCEIGISDNVNTLPQGIHSVNVKLYYHLFPEKKLDYNTNGEIVHLLGEFTVNLNLVDSVELSAQPSNITVNHTLGDTNPTPITVSVNSESNWSLSYNCNWLHIDKTSGVNNDQFIATIIPTGLNVGTHTTILTLSDFLATKSITVTLIVSDGGDEVNYLYATPLYLNFGFTQNGILPPSKRVELNSSGQWQATANQSWIELSSSGGNKGVGYLDIGLQNLNNLEVGKYTAIVSIKNGSIIKTVNVELAVFKFAEELLSADKLYYTDDFDNVIKVSSGRNDTHLRIKISPSNQVANSITYNLPFYNGYAQKRIGLEARRMLGNAELYYNNTVDLFSPYKPISLSFEINERELFVNNNVQTIQQHDIRFVKGITPSDGWLSEQSKTIFATKNGIVRFSFLGADDKPINEFKINGAIEKIYTFNNNIENIYTANIPLSSFNLKVGDELTINVNDINVKVIIKPTELDQVFVFWENKWGCFDCLECTGLFVKNTAYKDTSYDFRKDFKTVVTKVLDVSVRENYKIDTGNIYSDEEIYALSNMLRSSNIYLYNQNSLKKVRSTTKKIDTYKTNDFLKSAKLTFENKEQL